MANIIELITVFSLIGAFSIVVLKIWNLVNILVKKEKGYHGLWIFVGMGGYLIFWLFIFQVLVSDPATNFAVNTLYLLTFNLVSFFMIIAIMLTIIEFLLMFTVLGEQIRQKPDYRERGSSNRFG